MASHTRKAFLCLGRINVCRLGLQKSVSRVTIATALSANYSATNTGPRDKAVRDKYSRRDAGKDRSEKMPVDQDWTAVYPVAASFKSNAVPLPVRMGYPVKGGIPPQKHGNLELIKIPNFLHLTPAAIKKHCKALKSFCTEWPSALDTDAKCDEHFPIKVTSTDYVSAGPSIRNPSARIVHLKVKLSSLNLDDHARKKMLKLAGERYCQKTDVLTITTDRCPTRQQNYDYAKYLLTVLYHESWSRGSVAARLKLLHSGAYCSLGNVMAARQAADRAVHMEKYYLCERSIEDGKTEAWEAQKTLADMEEYSWEDSPSQKNILDTLVRMKVAGEGEGEEVREQLLGRHEVQNYKDSVMRLKNEGESENAMLQYKEAVKKLLNL